jgi:hypothetical protein
MATENENTIRAQASIKGTSWRCNAQFQPISKGMVECPKCFGAVEIDLTARTETGWPLGKPKRITCDHCAGEGEVAPDKAVNPALSCEYIPTVLDAPPKPIENVGWGKPLEPGPVAYVEPPKPTPAEPVASGWAMFDKANSNAERQP